jgi:uncharacterized protein GlcG (DUF336 family)
MKRYASVMAVAGSCVLTMGATASAQPACQGLPTHAQLKTALAAAVTAETSGLNNHMWATVVNRDGVVCAVAFSGTDRSSQWPISRVISAQKANTANGLSLNGLALSTANLYAATQPGGSLFGLQESNPVNPELAYAGDINSFGTADDPMIGKRVGGVNVFGGGLALYNAAGEKIGAIGVSGDTSCADHNISWKMRDALTLDYVPAGVADGGTTDNIIYDIGIGGTSAGGFGHPECSAISTATAEAFPTTHPISTVTP